MAFAPSVSTDFRVVFDHVPPSAVTPVDLERLNRSDQKCAIATTPFTVT